MYILENSIATVQLPRQKRILNATKRPRQASHEAHLQNLVREPQQYFFDADAHHTQ